ncbi:MAG: hypothetical protein AAGD32_12465 [Planctomycetota bacterium]
MTHQLEYEAVDAENSSVVVEVLLTVLSIGATFVIASIAVGVIDDAITRPDIHYGGPNQPDIFRYAGMMAGCCAFSIPTAMWPVIAFFYQSPHRWFRWVTRLCVAVLLLSYLSFAGVKLIGLLFF